MLDDMDSGVKILVIILVVGLVLVLAVPLIVILAAVIASFVLGIEGEAALLVPVCGPGVARQVRSRAVSTLDGRTTTMTASVTADGDTAAE
jgi:hypothetical protein